MSQTLREALVAAQTNNTVFNLRQRNKGTAGQRAVDQEWDELQSVLYKNLGEFKVMFTHASAQAKGEFAISTKAIRTALAGKIDANTTDEQLSGIARILVAALNKKVQKDGVDVYTTIENKDIVTRTNSGGQIKFTLRQVLIAHTSDSNAGQIENLVGNYLASVDYREDKDAAVQAELDAIAQTENDIKTLQSMRKGLADNAVKKAAEGDVDAALAAFNSIQKVDQLSEEFKKARCRR